MQETRFTRSWQIPSMASDSKTTVSRRTIVFKATRMQASKFPITSSEAFQEFRSKGIFLAPQQRKLSTPTMGYFIQSVCRFKPSSLHQNLTFTEKIEKISLCRSTVIPNDVLPSRKMRCKSSGKNISISSDGGYHSADSLLNGTFSISACNGLPDSLSGAFGGSKVNGNVCSLRFGRKYGQSLQKPPEGQIMLSIGTYSKAGSTIKAPSPCESFISSAKSQMHVSSKKCSKLKSTKKEASLLPFDMLRLNRKLLLNPLLPEKLQQLIRTALLDVKANPELSYHEALANLALVKNPQPQRALTSGACACASSPCKDSRSSDQPAHYTHLGTGSSVLALKQMIEDRMNLQGDAVRMEKVRHTGKEGKTSQGCPIPKWIIRRSSMSEKVLVLVRYRKGHSCESAWIIVGMVVWEGIPAALANLAYDKLADKLPKYGIPTVRSCETNKERTCACQGTDPTTSGASYTFGCSWAMYNNGCKFFAAKDSIARKVKLNSKNEEEEVEQLLQNLATDIAPLYKAIAPDSYNNQVKFEKDGLECRIGNKPGRPWSGITACLDFCAHSHKDTNNMKDGCTAVLSLTKHRGLGKADDEQLHVLPLYVLDDENQPLKCKSNNSKVKNKGIDVLREYPLNHVYRKVPLKIDKRRFSFSKPLTSPNRKQRSVSSHNLIVKSLKNNAAILPVRCSKVSVHKRLDKQFAFNKQPVPCKRPLPSGWSNRFSCTKQEYNIGNTVCNASREVANSRSKRSASVLQSASSSTPNDSPSTTVVKPESACNFTLNGSSPKMTVISQSLSMELPKTGQDSGYQLAFANWAKRIVVAYGDAKELKSSEKDASKQDSQLIISNNHSFSTEISETESSSRQSSTAQSDYLACTQIKSLLLASDSSRSHPSLSFRSCEKEMAHEFPNTIFSFDSVGFSPSSETVVCTRARRKLPALSTLTKPCEPLKRVLRRHLSRKVFPTTGFKFKPDDMKVDDVNPAPALRDSVISSPGYYLEIGDKNDPPESKTASNDSGFVAVKSVCPSPPFTMQTRKMYQGKVTLPQDNSKVSIPSNKRIQPSTTPAVFYSNKTSKHKRSGSQWISPVTKMHSTSPLTISAMAENCDPLKAFNMPCVQAPASNFSGSSAPWSDSLPNAAFVNPSLASPSKARQMKSRKNGKSEINDFCLSVEQPAALPDDSSRPAQPSIYKRNRSRSLRVSAVDRSESSVVSIPEKVVPNLGEFYNVHSANEEAFADKDVGGVAIALGHGSVLFECARCELHATTALKEPNRFDPKRISLVFYQHRNLNHRNHGTVEWQKKLQEKRKLTLSGGMDEFDRDHEEMQSSGVEGGEQIKCIEETLPFEPELLRLDDGSVVYMDRLWEGPSYFIVPTQSM